MCVCRSPKRSYTATTLLDEPNPSLSFPDNRPMMPLPEIVILAILQGITEFLPVSSSGHFVVGAAVFGMDIEGRLTFDIVLHLGTLAAILVFYWRRIRRLLGEDRRVIALLVVGTLPAAAVGLFIKFSPWEQTIEHSLNNPVLAGLMFPVTAMLLVWSVWHEDGQATCRQIHYRDALVIGLFQAVAILPGISRSGATIVAGLGRGLRRDEAAAFSFLLAIPAIAGGGMLESLKLLRGTPGTPPAGGLLLGATVSFGVGMLALWWLVRWLNEGRLYRFAWYLIPLGAGVLIWQLFFAADRHQVTRRAEVHHAVGDGRGGAGRLFEIDAGKLLELIGCGQHDHLALARHAIEPVGHADRRAEIAAPADSLPPTNFAARGVQTGDLALIAPEKQEIAVRYRRGNVGHAAVDVVYQLRRCVPAARPHTHVPLARAARARSGPNQPTANHRRADHAILEYA